MINDFINALISSIGHDVGSVGEILAMLFMVTIMSLYEFVVYRLVSHKSMYNKSFHISIMIIPFFIGAIVMALQSNLVITLGTIGALAIIRYRTAVKDPVDMMYILWSIFVGIACGCQLYELCILTSIVVTIILLVINLTSGKLFRNPYVLVINAKEDKEEEITKLIVENSKSYRLKSRNYTSNGVDYVYEVDTKTPSSITSVINELDYIKQFSLIEYDNEDIM
ncbi:MAG: MgtC/SapB family protein [Firmicutes bacterium]|nr:MgtC/SapB family protein [Candidatus Colivicinus equi]